MTMEITTSTEELARLLDLHMGDLKSPDASWAVRDSPISGRGLFAARDIQPGEEILRERTMLVGPTAHKNTKLNTCIICYKLLEGPIDQVLCPFGCALPVCRLACSQSQRHAMECQLFRKWEPLSMTQIEPRILRIVSMIRCLFLDEEQRKLLYAMQANFDRYYIAEVSKAAECFRYFPRDEEALSYFHRTICALNTNAFESRSKVDGHEIMVRALYPLAGLMNHECTPNAGHHFESAERIVIAATRFIPQGAEITTNYTKLLWSNLTRRLFLLMTKHFNCRCARCKDPTENGTNLSALLCREKDCKGIVIPVQTKTMQPDWRCLTCNNVFPHAKMARYQDFALNTINNRINTSSVKDMIHFINDLCPRFCPPSNYVLIEAKLNVIWRMDRCKDEYTAEELQHRDRYREEILAILKQLGAGECTLKKLITNEIE